MTSCSLWPVRAKDSRPCRTGLWTLSPSGLTIISCTTLSSFSGGAAAIGFYRRTTLIKYQRNLLFKLSLSANKRRPFRGGVGVLSGRVCGWPLLLNGSPGYCMLYNKFDGYVMCVCGGVSVPN